MRTCSTTLSPTVVFLICSVAHVGAIGAAGADLIEKKFRADFYRFGEGYTSTSITLATPAKIKTSTINGMTKKTYQGDRVSVTWIETFSVPNKPIPLSLRVSRPGHLTQDIYIGDSDLKLILKRFGKPEKQVANWVSYSGLAEICSDNFTFKFAANKLRECRVDMVRGLVALGKSDPQCNGSLLVAVQLSRPPRQGLLRGGSRSFVDIERQSHKMQLCENTSGGIVVLGTSKCESSGQAQPSEPPYDSCHHFEDVA